MMSIIFRNASLNLAAKQTRFLSSSPLLSNINRASLKNVNNEISKSNTSLKLLNNFNKPLNGTLMRQISLTPARMSAVDHSKLWTIERALAISLLASVPLALAVPNPLLDTVAAISLVMHNYWGFEAVINDYVRPILVGPVVPKLTHGLLVVITLATLGGLFYFNYNDIGFSRAVRRLWSLKSYREC